MSSSTPEVAIIASRKDPASLNIAENLIEHHGFSPVNPSEETPSVYTSRQLVLVVLEKDGIYVEPEDLQVNPLSILFASKHRSSTNTPALTVHATGNLNRDALYGGKPEQVSIVEPFRIREALTNLKKETRKSGLQIEVTMEATHHGPTSFSVPVCFVEVGSQAEQWTDQRLGRIASDAIMTAALARQGHGSNAVGFGGTHYPDKLTQMCMESNHQIGHIVPRRAFDANVGDQVIQETFSTTSGVCKTAIVDWKGLKSEQRRNLLKLLARLDVEVVKC